MQYAAKTAYAVDKVLAAFAIMVKMDLHVRYSVANHFRQRFQQGRMIFLFRKEKRISRHVTNRVGLTSPCNRQAMRTAIGPRVIAQCLSQRAATWVRNGPQWSPTYARAGATEPCVISPQALPDVGGAPNLRIVN